MIAELEIKKLQKDMQDGFKRIEALISGRAVIGNWVKQDEACDMLGIKSRRIRDIRIHMEKGKKVGVLRWRKGRGRSVEYHKADIEAYRNAITVA